MSSADKAKLDDIEARANNYTHPVYDAKQAGLYRISVDGTGHVATADKMTSEELTAEGISPVDHTHDMGTLADTLKASADAVEDADTVMVGATVTSNGSATTKYTRRPLATLWNWIKSKTDTLYAAVGHTHDYAGATEPGGDALNAMKAKKLQLFSSSRPESMNFNLADNDYLGMLTYQIASSSTKTGKPPEDSMVLNLSWDNSGFGAQVAIEAGSNPHMYIRGATTKNNASVWDSNWKTVAFVDGSSALSSYPVGSIYMSTSSTSPASLFGGSWTQLKDRFLIGAGGSYSINSTGGETTHKLTVNEMPSHTHVLNIGWGDGETDSGAGKTKGGNSPYSRWTANYTGGSAAHNNMPPYLAVYM